jgi:hypothetical protein
MALAITLAVLLALMAALVYARRRGWTTGVVPRKSVPAEAEIALVASRRISATTTAHAINFRGNEYMVIESARGVSTAISPLTPSPSKTDEDR